MIYILAGKQTLKKIQPYTIVKFKLQIETHSLNKQAKHLQNLKQQKIPQAIKSFKLYPDQKLLKLEESNQMQNSINLEVFHIRGIVHKVNYILIFIIIAQGKTKSLLPKSMPF